MVNRTEPALAVARLEARVAALEERLAERSRLLRRLTRALCDRDLVSLARLARGEPPLPGACEGAFGLRETMHPEPADIERTMKQLWNSLESAVEPDE
jgi:hypothetical protein